MDAKPELLEYKCPCCGASLPFDEKSQNMTCEYCDNTFDIETVKLYNAKEAENEFSQLTVNTSSWSEDPHLKTYTCQSCGGELITDENTAATFCPYCNNSVIISGRLSGGLCPDAVIPFNTSKEDAMHAFQKLCKGKPLLPKGYATTNRIEKITGIYVPFWLYDCASIYTARYRATRVQHWMDAHYTYTKTDHYLLTRATSADFSNIPMDASSKFGDATMESIEPFDFSNMVDFDTAYLSGFFADKYDVPADAGTNRIRQRVNATMDSLTRQSTVGYATVLPASQHLQLERNQAKYVLLPVWLLNTVYNGQTYMFAMNGQTGKMTGTFPICNKKSVAWFAGVFTGVATLSALLMMLL